MPQKELLKVKNQIANIDGWLSDEEAYSLYRAAKKSSSKGIIVEIGSWKGKSTICLGMGSNDGPKTKVYAIDPHTGSPDHQRSGKKIWTLDEFKKNVAEAGLISLVEPLIATSEEAVKNWKEPISLIHIDANYEDYNMSKKDFFWWSKHIINGGVIAIHNVAPSLSGILKGKPLHGCEAPKLVVKNFILKSKNYKNIYLGGTILYAEKCGQNSPLDRWKNWLMEQKINSLYRIHWIYLKSTNLPQPMKTAFKKIVLLFRK